MNRRRITLMMALLLMVSGAPSLWAEAEGRFGFSVTMERERRMTMPGDGPDVERFHRTEVTFAVRVDGSEVMQARGKRPDRFPVDERVVKDYSVGKLVSVDEVTGTTTTRDLTRHAYGIACAADVDGPRKRIAGVEVVGIRRDGGFTATRSYIDVWVAPELGCFALERQFVFLKNGREVVMERWKTLDLELGAPDPTLFQAPDGFAEVTHEERSELRRGRAAEVKEPTGTTHAIPEFHWHRWRLGWSRWQ